MTGTVERARGRWREILPRLGIETRYLTNKHGPCPLCGGKDRYRWDDRDGTGSYYCNQCGPGSGIVLVQKLRGCDFATACQEVDRFIGTDAPLRPASRPTDDREKRLRTLRRTLDEATAHGVVDRYLKSRGLNVIPPVLHGHPALVYLDDDRRFVGRFPAMVAPVVDLERGLQSVHRIYVSDTIPKGGRKKVMPAVDTISGCAVRLFDPTDTLGLAEGIETAIAAYELFDVPTWSTLTAGGIESVKIPPDVQHVCIFADHDDSFAGHKAAYTLAQRLRNAGLEVQVFIPPRVGTDWLDVLNGRQGRAA